AWSGSSCLQLRLRPPSPPPSPYTPLFRSGPIEAVVPQTLLDEVNDIPCRQRHGPIEAHLTGHPLCSRRPFRVGNDTAPLKHIHGDRKSTRLNSSHVKISYVVFCLKNKKTH